MKPTLLHSFVTSPVFPSSLVSRHSRRSVCFRHQERLSFSGCARLPLSATDATSVWSLFHSYVFLSPKLRNNFAPFPQNRSTEAIFCTSSMGAPAHLSFAFLSCCTVIVYLAILSLVLLRTGIYFLLLHSWSLTHNRHSRNIY